MKLQDDNKFLFTYLNNIINTQAHSGHAKCSGNHRETHFITDGDVFLKI
jgi:hypothetical protein